MKRLVAFVLFAVVFVGGVAWAQKKKEEIFWVHLNWVAREGNAKGCVQTTATESEMKQEKKLIETLMRAAQAACANSERAKSGSCPRGEAMAQGGDSGFGQGSCL